MHVLLLLVQDDSNSMNITTAQQQHQQRFLCSLSEPYHFPVVTEMMKEERAIMNLRHSETVAV